MNHCQTKTTNKIIMKIKHLLIGLFAVAATVACTQEQPAETPKLEVDKEAVSLAATAAESSFNVTSNQAWAATADADWVTLDPASGEAATEAVAVKVTAEDNTAKEARTAKVTVKAGELTKTVTVTQAAGEEEDPGKEPEPEDPNEWSMMGCFVDNLWQTDVPMTKEGEWIVAKDAQFTELTFKIRANASWDDATNIGVAPGSERGVVNGKITVVTAEYSKANLGDDAKDIKLNGEAGTYDVYFSFENLEVYVMEQGFKPGEKEPQTPEPVEITYTVAGTLKDLNWKNSAPEGLMVKEGDYYVGKNVPLVTAKTLYDGADQIEFKIVETGTWDGFAHAQKENENYINGEIPVQAGGENIIVKGAEGSYDVYFDKTNLKVWVMEAGAKPGEKEPVVPAPPAPAYNIISSTEVTEWGVDAFAALFTQYGSAEVTEDFICEDLYFFAGGGKFKFGENKNAAGEKVARFQFGGSGNYEKNKQIVKFFVPGPGTLKVEAISSGDTERPLMVAIDGTPTVETGYSLPVKAETPIVVEVDCSTATSGSEIALWSGDSGINVFSVKWIPAGVTETEPIPEPEPVATETTIWEGTHNTGNWSGLEELSWGRYDWSTVAAGQRLKVYVTPNDPSSDWWCLSLRSAGTNWPTLVGAKGQYDKATYSVTIPLTQETIDDLLANNGLVLTGSETTINKVTILPADAENVIWAGEMESNGYSNCTIGTVNDLANNGAAVGDKFRIYVEGGEGWSFMITDGQWNKWFATASDGSQEGLYGKGFDSYNTDLSKGYIEFEITEAMAAAYAGYGWGNLVILQGNAVKFTKISLL